MSTRAPVGGIFRHILDLAGGQAARGHEVGIITDSLTGGERAVAALAQLAPQLKLGVSRLPIQRELSPTDFLGVIEGHDARLAGLNPDVMHGHGAKGGALRAADGRALRDPRLHAARRLRCITARNTLRGTVYGGLERVLMQRTELFLFESQFARNAYQAMVGAPPAIVRVVPNGITPAEMEPVAAARRRGRSA